MPFILNNNHYALNLIPIKHHLNSHSFSYITIYCKILLSFETSVHIAQQLAAQMVAIEYMKLYFLWSLITIYFIYFHYLRLFRERNSHTKKLSFVAFHVSTCEITLFGMCGNLLRLSFGKCACKLNLIFY
jgi:hypothetical protein